MSVLDLLCPHLYIKSGAKYTVYSVSPRLIKTQNGI